MTHPWMYALAPCALPSAERWVVIGLAPRLEKIRAGVPAKQALVEVGGTSLPQLEVRWRSWLYEEASRVRQLPAAGPVDAAWVL